MRRWGVLGVLAVVLLTACTQQADLGTPLPQTSAPAPAPTSTGRLAADKKAAGIADCPASDPRAAAVPGGLPAITLPCLGGGRDVRLSGLRGRPLVINVWAQWCLPCRKEAPALSQAAAGAAAARVMFLGVDYVDNQPGLAIEFARLSTWRYPQLADPDKKLAGPLQIAGPPYTYFVRSDGTIAARHVGAFSSATQIRQLALEHLGVRL